MRFQLYSPSDRLKPYIKRFVLSESDAEQTYSVLPTTSLVMGFQYKGRLAYFNDTTETPLATAGITGIQNRFRLFKNAPKTGSVLIMFTETGAASFFKEPIHELFDESLALDHFTSRSVLEALTDQLSEAASDLERIGFVESFLLSRFQEPIIDPLVLRAVQSIQQSQGAIRISALLDKLCISQSPFEKRFRRVVGTSPKKFSSIVRMNHALQLLTTNQSLTQTSVAVGYFDQAHFSNEFKTFTGVSPTEFIRSSTR